MTNRSRDGERVSERPRAGHLVDCVSENEALLAATNARLVQAVSADETVELVFAVRGKVAKVGHEQHRWRIRTPSGHVVSFRPEFVIAITPS